MGSRAREGDRSVVEDLDERRSADPQQVGRLLRRQGLRGRRDRHGHALLHRFHGAAEHVVDLLREFDRIFASRADEIVAGYGVPRLVRGESIAEASELLGVDRAVRGRLQGAVRGHASLRNCRHRRRLRLLRLSVAYGSRGCTRRARTTAMNVRHLSPVPAEKPGARTMNARSPIRSVMSVAFPNGSITRIVPSWESTGPGPSAHPTGRSPRRTDARSPRPASGTSTSSEGHSLTHVTVQRRPAAPLPGTRTGTGEYPGRSRCCEGATVRGIRSPNIVILYADDLGWGDLGCFGADDPTPHR